MKLGFFCFCFSIKMSLKFIRLVCLLNTQRWGLPPTCSVSKMSRKCSRPRLFRNWVMFISRPETVREERSNYILCTCIKKNPLSQAIPLILSKFQSDSFYNQFVCVYNKQSTSTVWKLSAKFIALLSSEPTIKQHKQSVAYTGSYEKGRKARVGVLLLCNHLDAVMKYVFQILIKRFKKPQQYPPATTIIIPSSK